MRLERKFEGVEKGEREITLGSIIEIDSKTAAAFLLPRHYAGRLPTISKAFGWYDCKTYTDEHLKAVCTFGKPASPPLCVGVCGKEYANHVFELNRLCRVDGWDEPLSAFVSACLRRLRCMNWIIVSYSDTAMNHHGYVYQACNFLYTGCTKPRTDKYVPDGKHARHYKAEEQGEYRVLRSSKHRYVYFCTYSKRLKREWKEALRYPVLDYPKGDNSPDYTLGEYIKPSLVRVSETTYLLKVAPESNDPLGEKKSASEIQAKYADILPEDT